MSPIPSPLFLLACLAPSNQVVLSLDGPDLTLPRANQRFWVEVVALEQAAVTLRFQVPLQRPEATSSASVWLLDAAGTVVAEASFTDRVTLAGMQSLHCAGTCSSHYDLRLLGTDQDDVDWSVEVWGQWTLATEDDPDPLLSAWIAPASE